MSDHQHTSVRAGARHLRPLVVAFFLVIVFIGVEIVAGLVTGSLALLSDACHMATDALGLAMASAAITAANRANTDGHRTYGLYRLEILAALANAVLLFGIAGYVVVEAARRFQNLPEILSEPMLLVALLGLIVNLIVNLIGWRLLRADAAESINVEGALLEVLADLIGSIGVTVAALLIRCTGWVYADPLFGAAIGLFILPRAWRLGRRALRVLVQAAPEGLNPEKLLSQLTSISGVTAIYDLHVWTLTSEMNVATVHLVTNDGTDHHPVLDQARTLLQDEYDISHATLQVERDTRQGCVKITW